LYVFDEKVT